MAIRAKDAIAVGRALLGTPYSDLDCINFIKRIIRTAPGGVPGYTTAGTNTLWRSASASGKYRDLMWTQEGIEGARAGMLAFKRQGDDVHHVGLVTDDGTVLHSSSAKGCVVETTLDSSWKLLAKHRYIETDDAIEEAMEGGTDMEALYQAAVRTQSTGLNLRSAPDASARKLGSLPRGAVVDVLEQSDDGWAHVTYGGMSGYCAAAYLTRCEQEEETRSAGQEDGGGISTSPLHPLDSTTPLNEQGAALHPGEENGDTESGFTTLVREDADGCVMLAGRWRVAQD